MGNMRYSILEDGSWASCCPVQSFPGAMALKIEGFCSWWSAQSDSTRGRLLRTGVGYTAISLALECLSYIQMFEVND
jgi:hypothetical protein